MRPQAKPSELFVLRREDFLSFLEREPKVAIKIIALLCQRIRWQSEHMEESMLQPLPVRLARRLCALAADFSSEVHVSAGSSLRIFVGAARESVNRQLQALAQGGDPGSPARPHPAAEHDQADGDRAERVERSAKPLPWFGRRDRGCA